MATIGYRSRLTVEQGRIYWREVGDGPALVLLHGGWSDGKQWEGVIAALAKSYRCYILDLPGFGDSTLWEDQPVAVETLVDAFSQYLEALNLKRVSLVGHGLGGWVAAAYALRFPYAVHRLMLLEPEGVSMPDQPWICTWGQRLSVQSSFWAGLLETIAPLGGVSGPLKRIKTLLDMRRQIIASPMSGKLMYARPLKEMGQDFLDGSLHKLLVPTLILGREGASPRQRILAERFAALCHRAEVGLLPTVAQRKQEQMLVHRIQAFMDLEVSYPPVPLDRPKVLPALEPSLEHALGPVLAQKPSAAIAKPSIFPKPPGKLRSAAAGLLQAVPQLPQ